VIHSPFDGIALEYDRLTDNLLVRWLRDRIQARCLNLFPPGSCILEIGGGTGEDAIFLAQQGVHVTLTDASPVMIAVAQRKIADLGLTDRITCRVLDLNETWKLPIFDGAISNFGAFNCIADRRDALRKVAEVVRPGGSIGLGIMGRFCAAEMLWHGLHGDFKTAGRRLSGQTTARLDAQGNFPVYYPTPYQVRRELAPNFKINQISGLGVFIPPSDVCPAIVKYPRFSQRVIFLEKHFGRALPWLADHFWIEATRSA
jgi:ubiquinone/menaquinone biosynthesis C-methylase UbiE